MKKLISLTAALALIVLCSCGKDGYDVYLMIGQSNMAGRGTLLESDFSNGPEEGVFLLDSLDAPVPATHPYNRYSTIRKNIKMQQMGPTYSFGREMHARTGRKVLMVVNALGGSGLDSWMPGEFNFEEAVRRARAAQQYGKLKAIVWHQGCTDAANGLTGTYLDRLSVMVSALRDSLASGQREPRCATVPFVAGEVAHWNSYADEFNTMLRALPNRIPNSAVVSSEGCGMLRDERDPHFSRDAQILLGQRYADEVSRLLK